MSTSGITVDLTDYPKGLKLPAHAHGHACLCFVVSGCVMESAGKDRTAERAKAIIKGPGVPHRDHFIETSRIINVEISNHRLRALREFGAEVAGMYLIDDPKASAMGFQLYRELIEPDDVTPLAVEGIALSLIAEAYRNRKRTRTRPRPRWVDQVVELLHATFPALPPLAHLGREIGVHPVYLSQCFRAAMGCSVGEYVRRMRVRFAIRQMESTNESLAAIAQAAGFSDQSHLSRVFRRIVGMTPRQYATAGRRSD